MWVIEESWIRKSLSLRIDRLRNARIEQAVQAAIEEIEGSIFGDGKMDDFLQVLLGTYLQGDWRSRALNDIEFKLPLCHPWHNEDEGSVAWAIALHRAKNIDWSNYLPGDFLDDLLLPLIETCLNDLEQVWQAFGSKLFKH